MFTIRMSWRGIAAIACFWVGIGLITGTADRDHHSWQYWAALGLSMVIYELAAGPAVSEPKPPRVYPDLRRHRRKVSE